MKETVVEVKDVSIKFNMSSEKYDSFKEYIIKMIKQQITYHSFWALKNVSFEVKKGDTLGLIGLNGSGKSTILKIIAGILRPTQGTVKVKGKIAPLIELGAGFDGDLTGEENVYLNGALLGYSQSEMKKNYRDIVEFSELENFMNVPVKNTASIRRTASKSIPEGVGRHLPRRFPCAKMLSYSMTVLRKNASSRHRLKQVFCTAL